MTGAEMVLQALRDNGVRHVFGYPGGAVLTPYYDEIFAAGGMSSTSSCATSRGPGPPPPEGLRPTRTGAHAGRHAGDIGAGRDQCGEPRCRTR